MKTISQMQAEIKDIVAELGSMKEKCITENRSASEDEKIKATEGLDMIDNLQSSIELEMRTQETVERVTVPQPAKTLETAYQQKKAAAQTKKDSFMSFGEQLASVMQAGIPNGRVDPRLYNAASGLNEGTPSDGGFLVQQDFTNELLKNAMETGLLSSRCRKVTISSNSNSMKLNGIDETSRVNGSRAGGIVAYWLEEAGAKTGSKPKFRKIELNLNKMIGLCYATDELLDDSSALESIIRNGFADEFGFMMDDSIIRGTGAGMPLGILNSGCVVSVAAETGQVAATINYQNIVNMWSRLFARSRPNSVWLINQDCEPQLNTMSLAVGTGGVPVYLPATGASGSPYSTLFGRPVLPIEQAETLGTTGDIMLADFQNGYIVAEKGGMKADVSIHVQFIYDEQVFRFVSRVDGQPVLASAITPYKGTNTQSHFVKLDTRS